MDIKPTPNKIEERSRGITSEYSIAKTNDEATFNDISTNANMVKIATMVTPPFSLSDLIGRTVFIDTFDIPVGGTTELWNFNISAKSVLEKMDLLDIVMRTFKYFAFTLRITYQVQSQLQHVGMLWAPFVPSVYMNSLNGYSSLTVSQEFGFRAAQYKKISGVEIPLGVCKAHDQIIPWTHVYNALTTDRPKELLLSDDTFDWPLGKVGLLPLVPMQMGSGGTANAAITIKFTLDLVNPSAYSFR